MSLIQMKQVENLLTELGKRIGVERTINTTDGLTGGGDLSADRTIGLTGINLFLHNMNSVGMIARTGIAGTPLMVREIRGAAGQIRFEDGTGAQGNPTAYLVTSGVQAGTNYNRIAVDQYGRVTTAETIDYVVRDANYFQGTLNAKPLLYSGMGSAAPVLGVARSPGLRIAFRDSTGPAAADLSIGADTAGLWLGMENATAAATIKFYGGATLVGTLNGAGDLTITGGLSAATKSFLIPHPSKPGYKLQHGSLEGPEHGIYARGEVEAFVDPRGRVYVQFPDYWKNLAWRVTAHITGNDSNRYWLDGIAESAGFFTINTDALPGEPVKFTYLLIAERTDQDKLQVEIPE